MSKPKLKSKGKAQSTPKQADNLGKSMAGALLRMEIEVSEDELQAALNEPRVGWWGEQA